MPSNSPLVMRDSTKWMMPDQCPLTVFAKAIKAGIFASSTVLHHWVRVELLTQMRGEIVEVELTRERYGQDLFQIGDQVIIRPRNVRVFLKNQAT